MYRIGHALGRDPDELDLYADKAREWQAYFDWLDTRRDKFDYYFAQLAGMASQREKYKISEYLMPTDTDRNAGRHVISADEAMKILEAGYGQSKSLSDG